MVNIKGYLSSNFTNSFLIIFLPFYMIVSLIYLVKISIVTAQVEINFLELVLLYSYNVPDIIFYTLPISFVTAMSNLLIRLSQDNELIALYALGMNAKKILQPLLLLGLLFSILLLNISFIAMPLSKQFYKSFQKEKTKNAKLNVVAGKLGQKFGEYYIYVKNKDNDKLKDIVIYNKTNKDNEQFFVAKEGELIHKKDITSLQLRDGYGYTYSTTKLQQAKYKKLEVFKSSNQKSFKFQDILKYWAEASTDKDVMYKIMFFIFISLIPVLSIYLIASFSMINPRYQKNRSSLVIFFTTIFFYFIASSLRKWGNPYSLVSVIIIVWIGQKMLFKKLVSRFF